MSVTPYYEDDYVTLYHGDCVEVIPTLSDVDLVFTSPPYNLGTCNGGSGGFHKGSLAARDFVGGYATYTDDLPQDEYNEWQRTVVMLLWESLSDNGAIFYNHKPRIQNGEAILPTMYGDGLPLRQIIIWDRGTGMNFSAGFFLPKCEWIVVWAKSDFVLSDRAAGKIGDVWRISPETAQNHPAPFPIQLPATAINATTAATVLDPFAGSGTTLRAAKDAQRKAIGIEMDEHYCEIAAERLAQEVLAFT